MRLSKLYSNLPDVFCPVTFTGGINVVLGEIRLRENLDKDSHNLGKSTFGRLIDFAFLRGKDKEFFLFKHQDLFKEFVFFLEVELSDSSFITIRRSVSEATKVSFKKHPAARQDFTDMPVGKWDHPDVPFDRAKELLDTLLDWRALKPFDFRNALGYLLRGQDDYGDVFQLKKFVGTHADWKPLLAHLLGFDHVAISANYAKHAELAKKRASIETLSSELVGSINDASKIDGLLLLKNTDLERKQELADAFDFRSADAAGVEMIVDELDESIATLNAERYTLSHSRKKVQKSLEEDAILFDPDKASKLFQEAGVLFAGQIKQDFAQLIAFNKAITSERSTYLRSELKDLEAQLMSLDDSLSTLGQQRSDTLKFLSSADAFQKYKTLSTEIVSLRAEILALERQREFLQRLQTLKVEIRALSEEIATLQSAVERDVAACSADSGSLFSLIRLYLNEIVEEVIDRKALLSASVNQKGNIDFRVEILDDDSNTTSASAGTTYKKLLCIAFDMALLRAHLKVRFPRFVYHDGVFETLDPRKKSKLLGILRRYANMGIQSVVTLISPDMPDSLEAAFGSEEIVLRLHDEGESGRLFKMQSW